MKKYQAWVVISLAWFFFLYEYVLRASPAVMVNGLMADFGVTATALGVLVSCYYLAYVPLQIPCGVIVDRLGPRKVIVASSLLCVLGCFVFAKSQNLLIAQFGRFLMGAGSSCAYLCTLKLATEWFPPNRFALIAGLSMFMGTLGGVFGASPLAILVNHMGWRSSMMVAGAIGLVVMFLCWMIIKDHPEQRIDHQAFQPSDGFLDGLKTVLKQSQNWLIGSYGFMMYLPLSVFAELWGVPFLMELYGLGQETAALGSIVVFIGMGCGSVFGAWLSEWLKSYNKVMAYSALGTIVFFVAVIYGPKLPLSLVWLFLFLGGVASGGQTLYFSAAKEINSFHISGTVVGFTNGCVMLSGLMFQPLLGKLLDLTWSGSVYSNGTRHYDLYSYRITFFSLIVAWTLAWALAQFWIKETYPKVGPHQDIY